MDWQHALRPSLSTTNVSATDHPDLVVVVAAAAEEMSDWDLDYVECNLVKQH
jgi:hypothetical protein